MNNAFGAMGDPQFWGDVKSNASNLWTNMKRFGDIPGEADQIAEQNFPDSARDSSTKNAFRHALGTGMMAQQLGAGRGGLHGVAAATLAKLAGYGWEGLGADKYTGSMNNLQPTAYRNDTKHDLNANALGASAAMGTDQAGLVKALKSMAQQSQVQQPPGLFESSPGYMTRTVR